MTLRDIRKLTYAQINSLAASAARRRRERRAELLSDIAFATNAKPEALEQRIRGLINAD